MFPLNVLLFMYMNLCAIGDGDVPSTLPGSRTPCDAPAIDNGIARHGMAQPSP